MTNLVLGDEVVFRQCLDEPGDQLVYFRFGAVGEKHRFVIAAERFDVPGAIILLVRSGPLVLLDEPLVVLVDARGSDNTDLNMTTHALHVEVEPRLRILNQPFLRTELLEVALAELINLLRMLIGAARQADFRPRDGEKTLRISLRVSARFLGSHHIVGGASHLARELWRGAQTTKRFQVRQSRKSCEISCNLTSA